MPQNAKSGAEANEYGHETSRLIAKQINAVSVSSKSNEFAFEGRLITIRCARKGNQQVGVLYGMLDRIDSIVAAFEIAKCIYELYEMTPAIYKIYMRDSKKEQRIGLVTKKQFIKLGRPLSTVRI